MESNRKRKGFVKAKLAMSFYRAAKPSSPSKVKPSPSSSSTASVGYVVNQDYVKVKPSPSSSASVGYVVNQDYVTPQPKLKVSFVIPENAGRDSSHGKFDNPYGVAGDEGVDAKATIYISGVQERFRLERINSERKKSQGMH
uniref:Uncharacterized protein n=1 Tax=Davidia involucrata TaxID=16924 RepID=A0A5B7BPT2_DAVIN